MSLVRVVPCNETVRVSASGPLRHLCPHVDEVDEGRVEITWRTDGGTFELHSLSEWLDIFADKTISHEDLTDLIEYDLGTAPGVRVLSVVTTWETAGLEVKCSTSPIPAG